MASNNGDKPKMQITCPACNQVFSHEPPTPEISNNFKCSVVTVAHEKLIRCSNARCRQPFVLTIGGAQLAYQIQVVGDEVVEQIEGSKLIKSAIDLVGH